MLNHLIEKSFLDAEFSAMPFQNKYKSNRLKKVLIIDDDQDLAELLQSYLTT